MFRRKIYWKLTSCDGDHTIFDHKPTSDVSILPRLATGIRSVRSDKNDLAGFYSSPSCDGDQQMPQLEITLFVSILPRLATGIQTQVTKNTGDMFLFFPVLRRGSFCSTRCTCLHMFLFFPVLRRGSIIAPLSSSTSKFLFFPVLRRGSIV